MSRQTPTRKKAGLELRYSTRRGGSGIRHFSPQRTTVDDVQRAVLTRFRARENATLELDGEEIGGVCKLDRWTWWLDAESVRAYLAQTQVQP